MKAKGTAHTFLLAVLPLLWWGTLAATWHVSYDPNQPEDRVGSIAAQAAAGDTILIDPGTYCEHIALEGKSLTLLPDGVCGRDRPLPLSARPARGLKELENLDLHRFEHEHARIYGFTRPELHLDAWGVMGAGLLGEAPIHELEGDRLRIEPRDVESAVLIGEDIVVGTFHDDQDIGHTDGPFTIEENDLPRHAGRWTDGVVANEILPR